jgi:hypothetical protein
MHPDVAAASLPATWSCELVDVGAKVANAVQGRSRGVGDDGNIGIVESLPGGSGRVELKPGGAKVQMVRLTSTSDAICAVCDPLDHASIDQAGERRRRDARAECLSTGYQTPLAVGQVDDPLNW